MSKAIAKVEQVEAPALASESTAIIAMIERAARDPQVDIVKMKELFTMHREIELRRSEEAFNTAMSQAQAALIPVIRNKNNKQTHSNYADLAAIAEQALPIIYKHGFGLIFSEFESKKADCIGVACKVTHAAGYSERHEFNVPLDGAGFKGTANKTATHAYGSSFSYGKRYATCGVFNIATKDDDGNAASEPELLSDEQVREIFDLLTETGSNLARFLKTMKVEGLPHLRVDQFDYVIKLIKDTAEQRNALKAKEFEKARDVP